MIVAVTTVLLAAFWYVVQRTSLGRAQRACEQDRRMAACSASTSTAPSR
jgi:branched-chain amino acid transport system permease protein